MSEESNPKILLKAKNLHKSFHYPRTITLLKNVSLSVTERESAAIVGRSGEGKSTLLQILGTLEEPCQGEIWISDQLVAPSNKSLIRNSCIGFVFQSFHLLEDYTVLENVLMPARIARRSTGKGSEARAFCRHLLEKVGLSHRSDYHTKLLSGGEKQRLAVARAMCNDPKLILADEPSGNLDRKTAECIHELLLDFSNKPGKGLILVTHDKELAQLCTSRYQLIEGALLSS